MSIHIKDLIPNLLGTHADWKTKLLKEWPTIIGSLKDKVVLEKIEHDTIVLGVFHPAWIQELSFLKPIIIQSINTHLEKPYINNIRLKTTRMPKQHVSAIKQAAPSPQITYTLSPREQRALENIKDDELKKAMTLFLQRCVNSK